MAVLTNGKDVSSTCGNVHNENHALLDNSLFQGPTVVIFAFWFLWIWFALFLLLEFILFVLASALYQCVVDVTAYMMKR